jgi:hypothetical protein
MRWILLAAAFTICCIPAQAAVLYQQPTNPGGGFYHSSWWDPDGSNYDEYVWDRFVLSSDADVDTVTWRGTYDPAYGGDTPVFDFTVAIYGSIVGGSEPDLGHPPLVEYQVGSDAGETYAGVFGGATMYDYRFALPARFHVQAGVYYWVQIEGWQSGYPGWSLARASTGDSFHYRCQHNNLRAGVPTGCWFTRPSGDVVFSLNGTTVADTENPQDIPGFALYGSTPNPSAGEEIRVSFGLPGSAPAELALFDVAGRRVASRQVGPLGAGIHTVALAPRGILTPGVYLARLIQGSRSQTIKVIVAG